MIRKNKWRSKRMKRKAVILLLAMTLASSLFVGCGSQATGSNDAEFISDDVEYDGDYTDESYEEVENDYMEEATEADEAENEYINELTKSEETIKEYCSKMFDSVAPSQGKGVFIKFKNQELPVLIIKYDTGNSTYMCNVETPEGIKVLALIVDSELEFSTKGFIKHNRMWEEGEEIIYYSKYEDNILKMGYYTLRLRDGETSYSLYSNKTDAMKKITKKEFDKFISQHEWITADEVETWYIDFEEAYENMLILE